MGEQPSQTFFKFLKSISKSPKFIKIGSHHQNFVEKFLIPSWRGEFAEPGERRGGGGNDPLPQNPFK